MDNRLIVQDFLEKYAEPTHGLNGEDDKSANIFTGAISYAADVFTNHMMFGGMHLYNNEDKMDILDKLSSILAILERYQGED